MKKSLFILIALFAVTTAFSQELGKFRVGLDLGFTAPSGGGGGIMINLEPKYNIADNMNVGLRFSSAAMAKDIKIDGDSESWDAKLSANSSFMGTFDYYFSSGASSFAPYVGGGIGFVSLANVEVDSGSFFEEDSSEGYDASGTLGGLIRAGFEFGKFRMGLEYNLIPKTDLEVAGTKIGTVANSYLGIHIGFYVGGGKWKK